MELVMLNIITNSSGNLFALKLCFYVDVDLYSILGAGSVLIYAVLKRIVRSPEVCKFLYNTYSRIPKVKRPMFNF